MNTELYFDHSLLQEKLYDVNLRELIGTMIKDLGTETEKQNSHIINDVLHSIVVTTNEKMLTKVVRELLAMIVSLNKDGCIKVSAKYFSNIILLYIKDESNMASIISFEDFAKLQPLVAKVGGCISINNSQKKSVTLTMSILDLISVA